MVVLTRSASALLVVALAAGALAPPAAAQEAVPVQVQAAVIKKVLAYDEDLRQPVRVLVLHLADAEEAAEAVLDAFASLDVDTAAADLEAAVEEIPASSAAYLLEGAATEEIRALCVEHRILTLSGDAEDAEAGRVALAIGLTEDGNPEIVVHLPRLEEEGHHLPARLLSLARVIR